MMGISAVSTSPAATQAAKAGTSQPQQAPLDADGDHDGTKAAVKAAPAPGTGQVVDVTA